MPADPALYVSTLSRLGLFETLSITKEDRLRTMSIKENVARKALESNAGSVDDYLAQLEIKDRPHRSTKPTCRGSCN